MEQLLELIEREWEVKYDTLDENTELIRLAEDIASKVGECSVEDTYKMYIGSPALHLPGLIAFCIVDELGLDPHKINAHARLRDILKS